LDQCKHPSLSLIIPLSLCLSVSPSLSFWISLPISSPCVLTWPLFLSSLLLSYLPLSLTLSLSLSLSLSLLHFYFFSPRAYSLSISWCKKKGGRINKP
jgi:hypothetical protein